MCLYLKRFEKSKHSMGAHNMNKILRLACSNRIITEMGWIFCTIYLGNTNQERKILAMRPSAFTQKITL